MNAASVFFASRTWDWWMNQSGIVLEIVGAGLLVWAAFRSRRELKDIPDSYEADLSVKIRNAIATQAFTELKGFGLLALGLILQMASGFRGL